MARRSKKLNPAEKTRRQAKRQELDRLESITGMTERLTCLDSLACQAVNDCELQVEDLEFDLAASRLAIEFWADHPAAKDFVAMVTDLELEHRRHCEALTALAARFDAFLHGQANLPHVHLRPIDPYRQRVEEQLYPPGAPVG